MLLIPRTLRIQVALKSTKRNFPEKHSIQVKVKFLATLSHSVQLISYDLAFLKAEQNLWLHLPRCTGLRKTDRDVENVQTYLLTLEYCDVDPTLAQ